VTALDLELAGRILAAGSEVGATVVPPPDRVEIGLDCVDAGAVRPFWRALLGYREQLDEDGDVELQHPSGQGPSLWFQRMDPPRTERGRFHLDVFVPAEQVTARLRAALDAGGRLLTDEHAPYFWVLADPEGNEACVCTRGGDRDVSTGQG
jgi:4a-hydroxytetrahydrobiopterin dehydratase